MELSRYKRILLKLSGEALMGKQAFGLDPEFIALVAEQLKIVHAGGWQLAIVVGGGNIFRGLSKASAGMSRVSADQMGMLATIMNGMALQSALSQIGVESRVLSAFHMPQVVDTYVAREAIAHLEQGRVIIMVAGTGNPYFTTDTAAALRAVEIGAQLLLKGTKVDGVYDKDPMHYADAKRYDYLTFATAIEQRLAVMDQTAFTLCRENRLPVFVFSIREESSLGKLTQNQIAGTLIEEV